MKLQLKGLSVRYGWGANALTAVDSVDLGVPEGKTLGLVGESGCGKSSLGRAIVGLTPVADGEILLDGVAYTDHHMRSSLAFRRRVQMVFQDPYASLNPRMTILEMMMEALATSARVPPSERRAEAARIFGLVGLTVSALDRFPHQFSGGQRQRIAIARALAVHPEIVIHDEVTSSLDVSVQATILNLLRKIQRELRLSYVFISHDLSTVRFMSDVVAVMYLGRIVELAETEMLFSAPQHPYTKALIASIPQIGGRRRPAPLGGDVPNPRLPPAGCRFHTRCPVGPMADTTRMICIEQDPHWAAGERVHRAACHFVADAATPELQTVRTHG